MSEIPVTVIVGALAFVIVFLLYIIFSSKGKKPDVQPAIKSKASSPVNAPIATSESSDQKKKKKNKKSTEISPAVPTTAPVSKPTLKSAPVSAEAKTVAVHAATAVVAPSSAGGKKEAKKDITKPVQVKPTASAAAEKTTFYSKDSIENFDYYEPVVDSSDSSDGWTAVEVSKKGKKGAPVAPISSVSPKQAAHVSSSSAHVQSQVATILEAPKPVAAPTEEAIVNPVLLSAPAALLPIVAAAPAAAPAPSQPVIELLKKEVRIDPKKVGFIIGPKGATLKSIEIATECEIAMPKTDKDATAAVTVVVTGPASGIHKAAKAVSDLATKGYSSLIAGDGFQENSISIPIKSIPDVIGRNGSVIKAIQDHFKVKLHIPDTSNRDPTAQKIRIGVAGIKDQVAQAKEVIREITQYYYSRTTHPDLTHVELDIPVPSYSYIIGPKGSEIRHIQSNFKVSVHIPNSESFIQKVLVVGNAAAVQKAKAYIEKVLERVQTRQEEYEAGASKEDLVDESTGPHEEWMDKYTYKRPVNVPTPVKAVPVELESTSPVTNGVTAVVDETKPSWRNVAATEGGWYQNGSM